MASIREQDLAKLVQSATEACKAAEGGDKAEEQRALDALKLLQKETVTAELLQKTDAGKKVKKLCKHPSQAVVDAALGVVEAWKNCVRASGGAGTPRKPSGTLDSAGPSLESTLSLQPSTSLPNQGPGSGGGKEGAASTLDRAPSSSTSHQPPPAALKARPAKCGDDTRDKVRVLLAESLIAAVNAGAVTVLCEDPSDIAVKIEQAMLEAYGSTNAEYKAKARSLNFNLKDPKNPDLRLSVLAGDISAKALVTMSAEEMASDEQKKKMQDMRDALLKEAVRGGASQQASTDMFQCVAHRGMAWLHGHGRPHPTGHMLCGVGPLCARVAVQGACQCPRCLFPQGMAQQRLCCGFQAMLGACVHACSRGAPCRCLLQVRALQAAQVHLLRETNTHACMHACGGAACPACKPRSTVPRRCSMYMRAHAAAALRCVALGGLHALVERPSPRPTYMRACTHLPARGPEGGAICGCH